MDRRLSHTGTRMVLAALLFPIGLQASAADPALVAPIVEPAPPPTTPQQAYAQALAAALASESPPTADDLSTLEALAQAASVTANDASARTVDAPPVGIGADLALAQGLAAQPRLGGDAATACEAILCLAGSVGAGGGVAECVAPIRRYLAIRPPQLFRKRLDFLRLCPTSTADAGMDRLVQSMVNAPGAEDGLCTAAALNVENRRVVGDGIGYIDPVMPPACRDYFEHPYTDLDARVPVYVGDPMEGGFWSDPDEAEAARSRRSATQAGQADDADARDGSSHPRSAYSRL